MSPRPVDHELLASQRATGSRRAPTWVISVAALGGVVYLVLFVLAITQANGDLLHGLTIAPILVLLTVPIALWFARTEGDPRLAGIVMAGLVAKLLSALVRYYVAYTVYHGVSDAAQYDKVGRELASLFRRFVFTADIGKVVGTGFGKIITGAVYAVFGVSRVGGFLVFAWLGFLGLLLFARAFRIGVPEGNARRYLVLVLFLPSLLYWPSAIGKEAWMMLTLGLCAHGIACLFRGRTLGLLTLGLGMLGVLMMRPHITLILFVGLVFALLVRKAPARTYAAPLFRVVGLGLLLVLGIVLAGRTASFLGQESLTTESVNIELSSTETQTGEGGSAFTPIRVRTPVDMVPAFVTVFFRPFPFETSNAQGLLTAAEASVLLAMCVVCRKRLRSALHMIRTTPYVAFSIGYILAFVFAFSSFGNFGILARQRVQALPLLLVLFALPQYQRTAKKRVARGTAALRGPVNPSRGPQSRSRRPPPRSIDPPPIDPPRRTLPHQEE